LGVLAKGVCMCVCVFATHTHTERERERERETEGVREVKALSIISGEGGEEWINGWTRLFLPSASTQNFAQRFYFLFHSILFRVILFFILILSNIKNIYIYIYIFCNFFFK
jgi:hypothetical protein